MEKVCKKGIWIINKNNCDLVGWVYDFICYTDPVFNTMLE